MNITNAAAVGATRAPQRSDNQSPVPRELHPVALLDAGRARHIARLGSAAALISHAALQRAVMALGPDATPCAATFRASSNTQRTVGLMAFAAIAYRAPAEAHRLGLTAGQMHQRAVFTTHMACLVGLVLFCMGSFWLKTNAAPTHPAECVELAMKQSMVTTFLFDLTHTTRDALFPIH